MRTWTWLLGAVGLAVLAACVPAAGPRTPSGMQGQGTPSPAPSYTPPPARSLDRVVTERMVNRLAALAQAVQEVLRRETGNARLQLEPRDAWVDMVPGGGRSKRFTSTSFNGEQVVVMAVSEHDGDRVAILVYNPNTGQLVHRGNPTDPIDLATFQVRGQMGLEVEVTSCRRADGCAVGLAVAAIRGASGPVRGTGAPVSIPFDRSLLPPDFWRE